MATKKAKKNAAAVALGRKGGKKRAENLSPAERSEQARAAVKVRWAKKLKGIAGSSLAAEKRAAFIRPGKPFPKPKPRPGTKE